MRYVHLSLCLTVTFSRAWSLRNALALDFVVQTGGSAFETTRTARSADEFVGRACENARSADELDQSVLDELDQSILFETNANESTRG
jgi:hypothetical protein